MLRWNLHRQPFYGFAHRNHRQPPITMDLLDKTIRQIAAAEGPQLAGEIQHRLNHLTKPRGSLGRLEDIVVQYGLARGLSQLDPPRKGLFVFCGDHGIAEEGVSAYPSEVTHQMVRNFVSGGAAINVLCRQYDIDPVVVDMGVNHDFEAGLAIVNRKVARGTRNFLHEPAMTEQQAVLAVETGIRLAQAAPKSGYTLLGVGEMGIANTTASSAILAAISGRDPREVVGAGTGVGKQGIKHKAAVIKQALQRHEPDAS